MSVAVASFDWTEFFLVAAVLFAVTLGVRWFVPDRFLLVPRVAQFFVALPCVLGAIWGARYWAEGRGLERGAVWGCVCGLWSHGEWKLGEAAWGILWRLFPKMFPAWIAQKLGMALPKDEQQP